MKWLKKYWGGVLLLLFGGSWLWVRQGRTQLHQRAHYTIGYLTGWHPTPQSGIYYDFRFSVADSVYESSSPSEAGMQTASGTRIVVKYDSLDPTSSIGFFNLSVPDSIRRPPANGWRVPPFPIPRPILDRGKKP